MVSTSNTPPISVSSDQVQQSLRTAGVIAIGSVEETARVLQAHLNAVRLDVGLASLAAEPASFVNALHEGEAK